MRTTRAMPLVLILYAAKAWIRWPKSWQKLPIESKYSRGNWPSNRTKMVATTATTVLFTDLSEEIQYCDIIIKEEHFRLLMKWKLSFEIYITIAVHWSEAYLIPKSSRVVINETKTIKTPFEVAKKMSRKKRRRHLPSLLQEPRFFPLLDIERRKSLLQHLQHLFPEIYWIYFGLEILKSDKMSKMDDMMVQTIFFCQAWMGVCMALA